jgi:hypothetical protein
MQMLLFALDANTLEQLILNAQQPQDIIDCDAILYRLQLDENWQALDALLQSDPVLKEALHPIHPLTTRTLQGVKAHYNTVVRVSDVYDALNHLESSEVIQEKQVKQIQAASIEREDSVNELLASLHLSFNQLQNFYYHAAEHNLVVVSLQGEKLVATGYF